MPRLNDRNRQIPNGLKYFEPSIKWSAPPYASFDTIVQGLITARKANPHLIQKNGWPMDYESVANQVDEFNARLCAQFGWTEYYTDTGGGATAPFSQAHQPRSTLQRAAGVVGGAETGVDWIKSGAEAVPAELANKRAWTCTTREDGKGCPLNQKGDWTRFFTVTVSEAFRKALNFRREIKLSTTHDDNLGICQACDCPLKLKVHLPLSRILAKMPADARDALDKGCWITQEALSK